MKGGKGVMKAITMLLAIALILPALPANAQKDTMKMGEALGAAVIPAKRIAEKEKAPDKSRRFEKLFKESTKVKEIVR